MTVFDVYFEPRMLQFVLMIVLVIALIAYVRFLNKLRKKNQDAENADQKSGQLSATERERYARHIVLREVGGTGQQRLKKAKVLVVGAGGLGSPVLQYLAAAGVGQIGVVDDDVVSLSNLQRQVLFTEDHLDMPKVFAAQKAMANQNPFVDVMPYNRRLDAQNAPELIADYDLVLDGTDNFATRSLVNAACVGAKTPLVSGAIGQWEGQISVFDPANGAPCYACIFEKEPAEGIAPSCAEDGVVGALPGVVGSMMAVEAIKHITGAGQTLASEMLIYDALYGESRKITLHKNPKCKVCS